MATATPFASVKLPATLVGQARSASQPMRRSVASQIEYWATLGQVVEHSGLSVQEARTAIENYERAMQAARMETQAQAMIGGFLAIEADGSLADKVREVIADNRQSARKARAA